VLLSSILVSKGWDSVLWIEKNQPVEVEYLQAKVGLIVRVANVEALQKSARKSASRHGEESPVY
jgi:hypothetical protein